MYEYSVRSANDSTSRKDHRVPRTINDTISEEHLSQSREDCERKCFKTQRWSLSGYVSNVSPILYEVASRMYKDDIIGLKDALIVIMPTLDDTPEFGEEEE